VMRSLSHGVRQLAGLALPSAAALCRRRRMLGANPPVPGETPGPPPWAGRTGFGPRVTAAGRDGVRVHGERAGAAGHG
jgi:hypothetical protein